MCGIAGLAAADRLDGDDRDRVIRMRDVIAHRGPDDAGIFVDDRAALFSNGAHCCLQWLDR